MSATAEGLAQDRSEGPTSRFAVVAVLIAFNLAILMGSLTNIALPTIAGTLGISNAEAVWVINIYQLVNVMVMLPLSSLADQIGYRRVCLWGIGLFLAGTTASGLSGTFVQLLAGRALQGLGSAAIQSVYLASMSRIYPPEKVGRGLGLGMTTANVSFMSAPTLAAFILLLGNWHWLFFAMVPLAALAFRMSQRMLPFAPGTGDPFDWRSAMLSVLTFGLIVLGLDGLLRMEDKLIWAGVFIGGLLVGALQMRRERHRATPIIPLDLLKIPPVRYSITGTVLAFTSSGMLLISLPFLFQGPLEMSVRTTGLLLAIWPVCSAASGYLSGRFPTGLPHSAVASFGVSVMATGILALAAAIWWVGALWAMVAALIVAGLGFGLFATPNLQALMALTPRSRHGAVGGMQGVARLFGQIFGGIAVGMALAAETLEAGVSALVVSAGLGFASAMAGVLRTKVARP